MPKELRNDCLYISVNDLKIELEQLQLEGLDVSKVRSRFEKLIALGDDKLFREKNQAKANDLLDMYPTFKTVKGYAYREPSDLAGIRRLRTKGLRRFSGRLSDKELFERIHGAWLGRIAGCMLGKPVECGKSPDVWGYLKETGQYPLTRYISFKNAKRFAGKYPHMSKGEWFDKIDHAVSDDDTNYTTTGILVVKRNGKSFTPADVGQFWMDSIPLLATCTAERVAYRNMAMQIQPPKSAAYRNPYREFIGAQIRADGFGYVCLGDPELAAEFAWRDASISHIKNGIYGEMLVAAMIAAAPFADSVEDLLKIGLSEIPHTSRLYADISQAIEWKRSGLSYDQAVERIHRRWDEYESQGATHTISNAVICATALLYGREDFGKSICLAVQACFDTDCNGATVGSIMGMRLGARGIGSEWTKRLSNKLDTSLAGYHQVAIDQIARDTVELHKKIR